MAGNEKWMNPTDSAGTDGAIEGQSPAENSTNTASHATRVAKKDKQKQIVVTKQAETALVLATPTVGVKTGGSRVGGPELCI